MAFTVASQDGQRDVLVSYSSNINGDQALSIEMPDDGIVREILAIYVNIVDIATLISNPEIYGPSLFHSRGTVTRLFIGDRRWLQVGATSVSSILILQNRVTVLPTDELRVSFREIDTHSTPTADMYVLCNTLRIREAS